MFFADETNKYFGLLLSEDASVDGATSHVPAPDGETQKKLSV